MDYKKGWITLNRACNMRCKWCYAKDTGYKREDDMDFKMARDLVDIYATLRLRHITLIGGEPTLYPHLFDLLEYARTKNMRCGFLSNGLKYEDKEFVRGLYDRNMTNFSISLKGCGRKSFLETTGIDAYDRVLTGIKNCLETDGNVVVFFVLSEYNIDTLLECLAELTQIGVKKFRFSFVYNFDLSGDYKGYLERHDPHIIIEKFKALYPEIHRLTCGNFKVFPTFPACVWGADFIKTLNDNLQLSSGCQLHDRDDLMFDSHGYLIPCNAMYEIKMGRLYEDFTTAEELKLYSDSERVQSVYDRYGREPSSKCSSCADKSLCCACACQWSNYSFEQLTGN